MEELIKSGTEAGFWGGGRGCRGRCFEWSQTVNKVRLILAVKVSRHQMPLRPCEVERAFLHNELIGLSG